MIITTISFSGWGEEEEDEKQKTRNAHTLGYIVQRAVHGAPNKVLI